MEQSGKTSDLEPIAGIGDESGASPIADTGDVNRGRGRPRGSRGNGNGNGNGGSGHRTDNAGNSDSNGNNESQRKPELVDEESVVRSVRKPKEPKEIKVAVEGGKLKFKKGYAPLLTPEQTQQFVESSLGGAVIVLDSRWDVEVDEVKSLSTHIYKVLELFPVKLEENPLFLQRMFAIIALLVVVYGVGSADDRLKKTLKGDNDGILGTKKKGGGNGNEAANQNAASVVS